ncbi:MAG: SUMF1/EgtB/PvdO family nonheme iron enzyme [bacterium]
MPALVAFSFWLEWVGNLFPAASIVAAAISFLYLAHHGWKTREDWRFGPPWSTSARYLRKFYQEYGHLNHLGYGVQVGFYVLQSHPASAQRFSSVESHDIEGLMNWALLEKKSLLITGAPRTGKSTFLQALALRLVRPEQARKLGFARPRTPFYIPLGVIDPSLPFLQALSRGLAQLEMPFTLRTLRRAISGGRALFLFDGWEDIPDGQPRRELVEWLEQAKLIAGMRVPFLIACPSDFLLQGLRFNFPHFTVALRNAALQKFRTLRAVTETRMPAIYRNPFEQQAEYVLISPPVAPGVLRGTKRPIPLYYFHVAKYPVTNRYYRTFARARGYREPEFWREDGFGGLELPVVGVDWEDAEAYCDWLNQLQLDQLGRSQSVWENFLFRLPTDDEWEWAAGHNERLYPWGNVAPTRKHANFDQELICLTPVGSHAAGATPEGVMDMAGNVWEWTSSWESEKKEKRFVRGGGAFNDAATLRCFTRDAHAQDRSRFIGFRVVRVPKEPIQL